MKEQLIAGAVNQSNLSTLKSSPVKMARAKETDFSDICIRKNQIIVSQKINCEYKHENY